MKIIFFTTDGCHLCEQAWSMIEYLSETQPKKLTQYQFERVDIFTDKKLLNSYGEKIPVLQTETETEIQWPFSPEDLLEWLPVVTSKT